MMDIEKVNTKQSEEVSKEIIALSENNEISLFEAVQLFLDLNPDNYETSTIASKLTPSLKEQLFIEAQKSNQIKK